MLKALFFLFSFTIITPQFTEASQFYIPKPRTPSPSPIQAPPPYTTPIPTPAPTPPEPTVAPPAPEVEDMEYEEEVEETATMESTQPSAPAPLIPTENESEEVTLKIIPKIKNETSINGERKYTLLFSFTNSQLTNEAMLFYAKSDINTGEIDKYNPIVWRRVNKKGAIIVPKELQTKKVELLFSPGTYVDSDTLKFNLNFQLYKPGTKHADRGADVTREIIIKKDRGEYEAFLTRDNMPAMPLKELHSHIHFRHLGKALVGNPDGTNAYWVRITSEDKSREYIVPNNYKKQTKSTPQKSDRTYHRSNSRIVNLHGIEVINY